jgi:opacity protein-like surface antigen
MTQWWAGVTVVAVVCWAGAAKAAPDTHDGFQFRGTLGGGYLRDSESVDGSANDAFEATISGGAAMLELYLGGTPAPGLVLGGYLSGMSAPGPSAELDGTTLQADDDFSIGLGSIGPYVDFYPDAQGGFHLLGSLGYAQVTFNDGNDTIDQATSTGFTLGAGVGYDAFVADEWSLGALGRLGYAWTSHEISGITLNDNALMLGVSFSVSCH